MARVGIRGVGSSSREPMGCGVSSVSGFKVCSVERALDEFVYCINEPG